MLTVAYLANEFPVAVEPYVGEEIEELLQRGVNVIAGSVRRPRSSEASLALSGTKTVCLEPIRGAILLRAFWLLLRRRKVVASLFVRVLVQGTESPKRRLKALLHTYLGACYAIRLQEHRVDHIHVHHGYFGSWIAMVAAQLLGVDFSLTLHGSDLLVHNAYLDAKLTRCLFCLTISEYNRSHILRNFPAVEPGKIVLSRLGVDVPTSGELLCRPTDLHERQSFTLLAVGRLHAVKDHAFLIRACGELRDRGFEFECAIAGEGPERQHLEFLIGQNDLQGRLTLLGHVPRQQMDSLYRRSDVVVLTSRSEGIPLVLMEAMARGKITLAPAITGIPELVIPGKTGFLYTPGATNDFVEKILSLAEQMRGVDRDVVSRLEWLRHAARAQVLHKFSRSKNLSRFGDLFLQRVASQQLSSQDRSLPHEDLVLQQI
ncbi:MAG: colanic acid biosynthesis glycosyltransferase WcaL [Candidatus Sulfotelmatobacter sp.]|nr:colanic acid biosynthesis glycosyltransferase WcaL [Candidatus Sulfotelmatobacter sp.]